MRDDLKNNFLETARILTGMAVSESEKISMAGKIIADSLEQGGKILACGNGGSAADAQHFVAEFVGRLKNERRPFPAIALSVDPSVVTALGNDYGFDLVFARQIEGLGKPSDVLAVISTSGKSSNILRAIDAAKRNNLKTIALVGADPDARIRECDLCFSVPSTDTPRIQEVHMVILHSICQVFEKLTIKEQ